MKVIDVLILMAITMALTLTFSINKIDDTTSKPPIKSPDPNLHASPKRVSRFLAEKERNPRAADHCHKDHEVCYVLEGRNSTCCNNKCIDLKYDDKNCGACKKKCKFSEKCCRGQCVNLAYDKRHCGACNSKCVTGAYCIYGMCDYA